MREYEVLYLVGEKQEANLDAVRAEVEGYIAGVNGTLIGGEITERRKLAYPVTKERVTETHGTYVARRFTLTDRSEMTAEEMTAAGVKDEVADLMRRLELSKTVLRAIVVRADDLPELKPIEKREKVIRAVRGGSRPDRRDSRPRRDDRGPRESAPAVAAAPVAEVAPVVAKEAAPVVAAPAPKPVEVKEVEAPKVVDEVALDKKLDDMLNF